MRLPGPDNQEYALTFTLSLVAALEAAHGGLYRLADRLVTEELPLSEMAAFLKTLYRAAGCDMAEEALDAFLLRQPLAERVSGALLDILVPVEG